MKTTRFEVLSPKTGDGRGVVGHGAGPRADRLSHARSGRPFAGAARRRSDRHPHLHRPDSGGVAVFGVLFAWQYPITRASHQVTLRALAELDDLSLGNPDQSSAVQAVVAWFPPTDFLLMDAQLAESGLIPGDVADRSAADSPESLLLGHKITDVPELVRAANPETYIRPGAPPLLIQRGLRDDTVPYQQSATFAATARAILGEERVMLDLFPEARHGDPAFGAPENVAKVLDFLDGVFRT